MFERFNDDARNVVRGAQDAARGRGDGYIGTEHLLLALVQPDLRVASTVLAPLQITETQVEAALDAAAHRPSIMSADDINVLSELGIDAEAILDHARPPQGETGDVRRQVPTITRLLNILRGRKQQAPVASSGHLAFTKRAKKALECSLREALSLGDKYIGAEHILLGLVRAEGVALEVLLDLGVDLSDLRQRTQDSRPKAA